MDGAVTSLLLNWRAGQSGALESLMPLIYEELRGIARRVLRDERSGHTLTPTALVHELYLKLDEWKLVDWADRAHFLALASRNMRRLLVDHARARGADKRDGGERVTLTGIDVSTPDSAFDLLAIDQALTALAAVDARKAEVLELRLIAGLDFAEIGAVTGLSRATLDREFRAARAWLLVALK